MDARAYAVGMTLRVSLASSIIPLLGCALCGVLGAAGGCAAQPDPRLREASVTVGERTSSGQVLNFTLLADNPSTDPLPLREVRYTLTVEGKEVFRGVRSPEATLRRYGTQQVTFPAVIPVTLGKPLPAGEVSYVLSGTITYIRPGAFSETLFDAEIVQPSVDFTAKGKVPLAN